MDRNASLINEYNSTEQQLAPLQGSENQMHDVDTQVAAVSGELSNRQGYLSKTQQDDAHMRKRIHRNENPRFLHYLVCNRDAKVERLKGELNDLLALEQDLSQKIATQSTQLSGLQQQQQNAHAVVERKHQLESHLRALFDQVVDAQPPTQALQQYCANLQQNRALLASEQRLRQGIDNSIQLVKQGLSLFQEAEGLYRQAFHLNERAKQTVYAEQREERRECIQEAYGNERGAFNSEMHREHLESQERQLQHQRDNLINRAHDAAIRAYQVISTAFSSFPIEAKSRYPQLCVSIGQVAFPRVEGANFTNTLMTDAIFGAMGAAMNDFSSGCKIQNNMRIVEQCASMSSQQLGLVVAVQSAVNANVQQIQANVQSLDQSVLAERQNIFNSVRAAVSPLQ